MVWWTGLYLVTTFPLLATFGRFKVNVFFSPLNLLLSTQVRHPALFERTISRLTLIPDIPYSGAKEKMAHPVSENTVIIVPFSY